MIAIFSLASVFTGTYAWFSMNTNVTVTGSQFKVVVTNGLVQSISAHSYLGLNDAEDSYCFNPVGKTVYKDGVAQQDSAVALNGYDPMNPSHPVMLLFRVKGDHAHIRFKTDYCYLGNTDKYCTVTATYASYTLLSAAADGFNNNQNGNYYKVTVDENHSNATTFYQFNYVDQSKSLKYMSEYNEITTTYPTYNDLINASIKVLANDGKFYRVTADESHGGDQTVYQYNHSSGELNMVYLKLKSVNNPLSSVVKFNWMRFKNKNVQVENTYNTYTSLTSAGVDISTNDGKYYKVTSDSNVGGGETIYQYDHTSGQFVLAWDYLDNSDVSRSMISLDTVNLEQYSNKKYSSPVPTPNSKTVSIKKNILIDDHESSFCTFNSTTPVFENEITAFKNTLDGADFVGIVIDYNIEAIEYICSAYLGHEYVSQGLGFHCDWTTII